jgi:hypothetical protein
MSQGTLDLWGTCGVSSAEGGGAAQHGPVVEPIEAAQGREAVVDTGRVRAGGLAAMTSLAETGTAWGGNQLLERAAL